MQSSYIYCGLAIGIFHCQTLFNFAEGGQKTQHTKAISIYTETIREMLEFPYFYLNLASYSI